ncbi:hypothetical protein PAECIP111893_04660 [Paenibacillus plantiphilus]|uniref:Anti-sigma-W factor RsiW n=1 Tax=Paenibacillus plantiphilus TaxID=2905650 RepID=A0ABM9CR35_9BACL|nr:zf-HC2 domain-containing protein [Paenibacillus plantiphilus]CAH1221010.1 hypothetical protein PAECIP111893_04660 [Paenibacillus plantiphilus]
MNCQEVMEYMQRQLDGDLDEREAETLMTHTRHCQDCATMLDRLQLLSVGLENLPKVTPSYSLVDAIMPRLMDLQLEAAQPAITEQPLPTVTRTEVVGRFSGWKNRFSMRALSGVIAAGVVVGLFLVTYNPSALDNNLGETASQSMTADEAVQSNDSLNMSDADFTSRISAGAAVDKKVEAESAPPLAVLESDVSLQKDTSKSVINQEDVMVSNQLGGEAADDTAADEPKDKMQSPNYETIIAGGAADGNYSIADRSGNAYGANQIPENPVTGNAIVGNANDGAASGSKNTTQDNNKAMGIAVAPQYSVEQTVSPDGAYKVVIVNNQLQIYLITDSTLLFESVKRTAGFGQLHWSEDSKALTYETTADDGKLVKFVIDPKNGTEQKQP